MSKSIEPCLEPSQSARRITVSPELYVVNFMRASSRRALSSVAARTCSRMVYVILLCCAPCMRIDPLDDFTFTYLPAENVPETSWIHSFPERYRRGVEL